MRKRWYGRKKRSVRGRIISLRYREAAASYALVGRLNEAHKFMARMRELDPVLRISNLRDLLPLRRAEDFAKWADGLRKAGLPE